MRAGHPEVLERWENAARAGRLRISAAVRLEILFAAPDGAHFETLAEQLTALTNVPLNRSVLQAAEAAMRALALRCAGAHRIPIVDYLVAATAQEIGAAVLHYDH